jgi:hypothetical protein
MVIHLNEYIVYAYISVCCFLGFIYGIYNWVKVCSIKVSDEGLVDQKDREVQGETKISKMNEIADKIQDVK